MPEHVRYAEFTPPQVPATFPTPARAGKKLVKIRREDRDYTKRTNETPSTSGENRDGRGRNGGLKEFAP